MKNNRLKIFNFAIFATLLFFAVNVSASVVINEIAWMGTVDSASNEWIELFNDGNSSVDLSGWILRIEGKPVNIVLKDSITAGGYYLIERTDDSTVPSIPANLITPFGNGLANTGATLVLFNAQETEVDRVNGSDNWKIGGGIVGNNTTKETAQRSGSGWTTAPATPRAINTGSTVSTSFQTTVSAPSTSSNVQPSSLAPQITVDVGSQSRTVLVGAQVTFEGRVLVSKKEPTEKAGFIWNFNDGTPPVKGASVTHIYSDAGEYWVTIQLDPVLGYFSDPYRIRVIVVVPNITLLTSGDSTRSFIEIENRAEYEIDLSGWQVSLVAPKGLTRHDSVESKIFTFYPNTLLVARGTIKLASDKTGLSTPVGTIAELRFPNGIPVQLQSEIITAPLVSPAKDSPSAIITRIIIPATIIPAPIPRISNQEASVVEALSGTATSSTIKSENKEKSMWPWYTGVAFLGVGALLGLRLARSKRTLADEFEIIEDKN